MNIPFRPWPSLQAYAKLFPSKRFPGLFYYDHDPSGTAGRSGKPVLILIHGLGDEADTWRHLIPLLGAAGYRTLAPDLPGFGRSPIPRHSSLGRHRDAVLELAEAVSETYGSGIVLVGSSMGAAAAEAAALAASAKNQNSIKALVLLDGCIPVKTISLSTLAGLLVTALPCIGKKWYRSLRDNPQGAWRSLFSYYADIHSLSEEDKDFLKARVMDRVLSPSQERGYFSSLRSMIFQHLRSGYYRRIGRWPGKIALVWGEKDTVIPPAEAELFLKLRAKAAGGGSTELSIIPGAGHLPHQEKPAETAEAILAFLQREWGVENAR
jgi:pimeloyl-ACP methyl ester carboxylesterase